MLIGRGLILKRTRRIYCRFLKKNGIFKLALRLRDQHVFFHVKIYGDFERFQYFDFETDFLKN